MASKSQHDPIEQMMLDVIPTLSSILNGSIWEQEEEAIKTAQASLAGILAGLKFAGKKFDERLVELRKLNPDALSSVEHFRKPRESKSESVSLTDIFKV